MSNGSGMLPTFGTPRSPLEGYLEKAGWQQTGGLEGVYAVWTDTDRGPSTEILVPLDESRADYKSLYNRAFSQLEQLLSPQTFHRLIAQQEIETERDLAPLTWTRESPTPSGTIIYPAGEALHAAIGRQLTSSARSAVEPKAKLGRSNAYVGREYIDNSLLAPSGTGSYVVTVLAPLHQRIYLTAPEDPKPDRPPRERRSIDATKILRTFDEALDAVTQALTARESRDAVEHMKSAVNGGVSQELVEALADFVAGQDAAVVLPRQLWTPGATAKEYTFEPRNTFVLREAAEALEEEPEATPSTVTGVITLLRHEHNTTVHTVHLFTTSPGQVRRVRVNLSEEDYQRAVEAHGDDSLVRISGTLAKDGKFWWIREVENFHVMGVVEQELEEAPLRSRSLKSSSWEPPFDFDSPF